MSGLERPAEGTDHATIEPEPTRAAHPALPVIELDALDDIVEPTAIDLARDTTLAISVDAPVNGAGDGGSRTTTSISQPRSRPQAWARAGHELRSWMARLGRGSRWVTLRRVPIVVAIVTALITFPMVRWLEERWAKADALSAWNSAERDVAERANQVVRMLAGGPQVKDGYSWLVYPAEHRVESLGETDIEPPLFKFAAAATENPTGDYFQQAGSSFISHARPVDGKVWVVSILDIGWHTRLQSSLRSGVRRGALLAWLFTSTLVGLFAHFLTRPARRTLRERADFLADAAHEMRTPLAVIQASAGHALARPRDAEGYVRSLAEIRSAAERASTGVTELLDLARFDAGQAVPRLAPLRLDLLGEEIAAATRVDDCTVSVEVGPSVLVEADMALLRQAIDNLVRNAAARSSTVLLSCAIDGRDGVLRVSDDGPGFAAEQLPYVFERYRRGDGRGSLGLGLPIAASIVAAHGGRVEIASPATEGPGTQAGGGSTLTVRLPRSRVLG